MVLMKKPRKLSRKTLIKKLEARLDKLWAEAVKERDHHACRRCGKTEGLNAHHLVGKRGHKTTKWDVDNGMTLCWNCHFHWAHLNGNELIYSAWVVNEIGQKMFDYLQRRATETQFVTLEWLQDQEQELRHNGKDHL